MTLFRTYRLANGDRLVEEALPREAGLLIDDAGRIKLDDGSFIEPRVVSLSDAGGRRKSSWGADPRGYALDSFQYFELVFVRGSELVQATLNVSMFPFICRLTGEAVLLDGLTLDQR